MPNYRRTKAKGGTFFFTVVTYRRRTIFNNTICCEVLRRVVAEIRKEYPFDIDGWVLMPDHMHCIWTLPKEDDRVSIRWGLIKSRFTKLIKHKIHKPEWMTPSKSERNESTVWQRRFWEGHITDDTDYENHMNYLHYNPVKHGLVNKVIEWPYSTFHRYVKQGVYSKDWGNNYTIDDNYQFGE